MLNAKYLAEYEEAGACIKRRDWPGARRIAAHMLASDKRDANAHSILGLMELGIGNYVEAAEHLQRAVEHAPDHIEFRLNLGNALIRAGRFKAAVKCLESAVRMTPDHPRAVAALAEAYDKAADFEKAAALLKPRLEAGTADAAMAAAYGRMLLDREQAAEAVEIMSRFAGAGPLPSHWHYTLGRALERLDRIDEAFETYAAGNRPRAGEFNLQAFIARTTSLLRSFTRESLASIPRAGDRSLVPLIIAGRPRSGTTLIEKILDAHPQATGVGENRSCLQVISEIPTVLGASGQPFPACVSLLGQAHVDKLSEIHRRFIRRMAPKAAIVADKTLSNHEFLGLYQLIQPGARVIHCVRDPVDVCLSCFAEDLRSHPYSNDLRMLGITQRCFEGLMSHWAEALDLPTLTIEYESLVSDPEPAIRKLIDFCGLPWDDRCLSHHESAGDGLRDTSSAPTLSYSQARRPIYSSAVGRASRFRKHLAPLHEGFAEGERLIAHMRSSSSASVRP